MGDKFISHLRFADDIILLSESPELLETMIHSLKSGSYAVCLEMNLNKTKVMTNSKEYPLHLDEKPLEYMDEAMN